MIEDGESKTKLKSVSVAREEVNFKGLTKIGILAVLSPVLKPPNINFRGHPFEVDIY